MDETELASGDPEVGLRAVAALHRLGEGIENIQVANARRTGWSWAQLTAALGVSKHAAHQKHRDRGVVMVQRSAPRRARPSSRRGDH